MFRNKTSRQDHFATVPREHITRSKFPMRQTRKQAFDASDLIPVMCEEVLPGDVWQHQEAIMARLATPIAPAVDDIDLETFYFFVPNRIIWPDWEDFITGTDTALLVPTITPIESGVDANVILGGVFDHFGILPQTYASGALDLNVLPIWGYFTCWNEWFRDQNLQTKWTWSPTWTNDNSNAIVNEDTPTPLAWDQMPLRINKRSDYFTRSLPWPQKGAAVALPLGSTAPIIVGAGVSTGNSVHVRIDGTTTYRQFVSANTGAPAGVTYGAASAPGLDEQLFADLGSATAATINSLRLAAQTQKLLELDARGGSRYVENLIAHWGVRAPDFRLARPEYLGGSKIPITVNPVAQTAQYDAQGVTDSPVGNLGAEMHASGSKRTFTYSATEHGYILGLACVRATPTYQQGTRRHWRRQTRLDYPDPIFAEIGEQAVLTQEIFQPPSNVPTNAVWGYQERYGEMRYTPNEITGVLRSTAPAPLDWWHYAEEFASEPALNGEFITDKTKETLSRSLATSGTDQWSAQIILDIQHNSNVARLLPAYGVPGIDKF